MIKSAQPLLSGLMMMPQVPYYGNSGSQLENVEAIRLAHVVHHQRCKGVAPSTVGGDACSRYHIYYTVVVVVYGPVAHT
jgi:hypothetical protein